VWDPYVRLNRSAESATGGSGIGLSVVRELVELHGGRTRAEGSPAGGARVLVELPLNQPEQPTGPTDSADSNLQLKVVP
jgi:signal transduction histidine kinase